jgi:hypothetical protein
VVCVREGVNARVDRDQVTGTLFEVNAVVHGVFHTVRFCVRGEDQRVVVNAVNSDYLLTVCRVGQALGVRYRERTRELANSAAVHVTRDRLRNGSATVVDGRSRAEGGVQLSVRSLTQVRGSSALYSMQLIVTGAGAKQIGRALSSTSTSSQQ